MTDMAQQKIILALDVPDQKTADQLIAQTSDYVGYYKIGLGFLAHNGIEYAASLAQQGIKIFLDLKLFDIGQTVTDAVARLADKTQAHILTVHGDPYVVSAAVKGRALAGCNHMDIFGVTILTSVDLPDALDAGYKAENMSELVASRAKNAAISGADGVIASAHEAMIVKNLGYGLKIITPGIRLQGSLEHDQKRIMTPTEALKQGADMLVIGREITQATDPAHKAKLIHEAIMP